MSKITKIEMQKNNDERASIFVDDLFFIGTSYEIIYKLKLETGREINRSEMEAIIKLSEADSAFNKALNALDHKHFTKKEMFEKLKGKGFEEDIIDKAIEKLESLDFIDDDKYASMYTRDKLNSKVGPQNITAVLIRKGIDRDSIKEILSENYDEDKEYENCKELALKKTRIYKDKKDARSKMFGFLVRKGYSFDIAGKVSKEVLSNSDEDEDDDDF